MESLYCYYRFYGNVIIVGDFNGSIISYFNINVYKFKLLIDFVSKCEFCMFGRDFKILGELFIFVFKNIMFDYILFNKCMLDLLVIY